MSEQNEGKGHFWLRRQLRQSRSSKSAERHVQRPGYDIIEKSGLFDPNWYTAQYPDVVGYPSGALLHYLDHGSAEGRDPNPCFSTRWYISAYPEVTQSGLNPLHHYIVSGATAGLKPSENFDPAWYSTNYPDAVAGGMDPLLHYLRHGRGEGRRGTATDQSRDLEDTRIYVRKPAAPARELAIFVTHAPAGKIKPHVLHYVDALRKAGLAVIVVIVAQHPEQVQADELHDRVDGLFVRDNAGYDFAAWAQTMRRVDLAGTEMLCLVNDSLIGPIWADGLTSIMARVRESDAGLIGLTENHEFKRHLQSFFLVAKGEAVKALAEFLENVRILENKQEVIMSYEVQLADALEAKGFRTAALFSNDRALNRTIKDWKGLIKEGFPFIKVSVIQDEEQKEWEAVVHKAGYNPQIVKESLAIIREGASEEAIYSIEKMPSPRSSDQIKAIGSAMEDRTSLNVRIAQLERELMLAAKKPWRQVRNKIKFKLYRLISSTVPSLSKTTAEAYARRAEKYNPNRFLRSVENSQLVLLESKSSHTSVEYSGHKNFDPKKPNVLVASHQASRTGAPILALNVAEILAEKYNVTSICLTGGELIEDFMAVSEVVVDAGIHSMNASDYKILISSLCGRRLYDFAIVNSVESHALLENINKMGVPSVALLHEFASYTGKKGAFATAMRWADHTVFSTRLTLENAMDADQSTIDANPSVTVLPQGKCRVPTLGRSSTEAHAERERLREKLRPAHASPDRFLVMGAGTVEIRKGVDLFLETATRALKLPGSDEIHFVWIGAGYDPVLDFHYSVYLRDQLRRAGIEERVTFMPATSEIDLAYDLCDAFLLTSRLDPLPNVAIDAMCKGLPVLCFNDASGVSDLLVDAGLANECVASYIDTAELAEKLVGIVADPVLLQNITDRTRSFAQSTFDLHSYVSKLEEFGLTAKVRRSMLSQDIETIVSSGDFRSDFFLPVGTAERSVRDSVEDYCSRLNWIAAARKPEPGFQPFVFQDLVLNDCDGVGEPYAEFLRRGRPAGAWLLPVIEGGIHWDKQTKRSGLRAALHIHAYHLDGLSEIIQRLHVNTELPDLFVTTFNDEARDAIGRFLENYRGKVSSIQVVPNLGRDIGPLLTLVGSRLIQEYDVIGHVHLKESAHLGNRDFVDAWIHFQLENVLGGERGGAMIDTILDRFRLDQQIGIVYPDDPYILGWTRNRRIAERLARDLLIDGLSNFINFPIGTMFWIRVEVLKYFVDIGLNWGDYPIEPIPSDGTVLHAIERLFGVVPISMGWGAVVTNIRGVTR